MSTKLDANQVIKAVYDPDNNALKISGGGAVDSVNGQTGVVVLDADDVNAANQNLSNLDSPTSVNQHLLPNANNTIDLGSDALRYNEVFVNQIKDASNSSGTVGEVLTAIGDGTFDWSPVNSVISYKPPVNNATTANITLSGEQTIDGILTSSSRILVKNQSTASQNGIYVTAAGAWTRATDMDSSLEFNGAVVVVLSGTLNANTIWKQDVDNPTVGSTSITWTPIAANTNLSNLTSPTSINQDLIPSTANTFDNGSFALPWNDVNANIFLSKADTDATTKSPFKSVNTTGTEEHYVLQIFPQTSTIPSGSTVRVSARCNVEGQNIALLSCNSATANASATGNLLLETGNKTAGTGNSGDVVVQTGTSSGGTRGAFRINANNIVGNNVDTGIFAIKTANTTNSSAQEIHLIGGDTTSGTGGFAQLFAGNATTGTAGDAIIRGGAITGAGGAPGWGVVYGGDSNQVGIPGGSVIIASGLNSAAGDAGDILIHTGEDGLGGGVITLTAETIGIESQNGVSVDSGTAFTVNIPYADGGAIIDAPTTGFTYNIANGTSVLILNPAGTLATGTINLPATPPSTRVVRVSSTQTITALTVSGQGGDTLSNAPVTIAAGGSFALIYISGVWYPYP